MTSQQPIVLGRYSPSQNGIAADSELAATLTTRYDAVGPTNITTLAHYPMTVILLEYEI